VFKIVPAARHEPRTRLLQNKAAASTQTQLLCSQVSACPSNYQTVARDRLRHPYRIVLDQSWQNWLCSRTFKSPATDAPQVRSAVTSRPGKRNKDTMIRNIGGITPVRNQWNSHLSFLYKSQSIPPRHRPEPTHKALQLVLRIPCGNANRHPCRFNLLLIKRLYSHRSAEVPASR
jgi:hypothetical protein